MNSILIIAHAPLAHALRQCALHVFPDAAPAIAALDVQPNTPPEQTLASARILLEQLQAGARSDATLVLTDTFGATPCNVAQRLVAASRTTSADVDAANAVRDAFTAEVDAALARFPVLALPTMADAPPSLDQAADTSRLVSMTSLVRPFNLSGHPAIAIPLPARSGFPVSLQLVAARGHDELLCAVARHVASRLQ